ncbi:N-acetylmuramoyl-L-alanine amidase [Lachnospiraceae bacterium TWA4]|nr:N-acetylmuramoyl-L-alanine amidase [Lachnospiraceae bacterium TWA4]
MKIIESIMKRNPCYKAGRILTVKGLMLHSVGCSQPKALAFIKKWNKSTYHRACVHAFIDANDGLVYQTLPWNIRGWHCGASGNNTHIGIEMCEPETITYTSGSTFVCTNKEVAIAKVIRTYEVVVELFAMLCTRYGLNPLKKGVILSHTEGHDCGIASNHGDPEHLWKGLGLGYTMDGFRRDVQAKMSETIHVEEASKKVVEVTSSYKVRVEIDNLNIRKGPGTNYAKTGKCTGKGVFTIIDESLGKGATKWGKLKSNVGWISLDYAKKIE